MKKGSLAITLVLVWILAPKTASAGADAGMPGSFLTQPVGARGNAIGQGYCSMADDATAVFWNPAGISMTLKPELNISRTWLFEDTEHSFLGFSYPLRKSMGIAAAYVLQSSKGYEKRTNPFDTPTKFSISNDAVLLGFGSKIPLKNLQIKAGIALKTVRHVLDTYSDTGFGADAGVTVGPVKNFSFSLAMHNVLKPRILLVSRETVYPSGMDFSSNYARKIFKDVNATGSISVSKYENRNAKLSFGGELVYTNSAFLRFGKTENGFSAGIGLKTGNYALDYSAVFHELLPIHTVSLVTRFGITGQELEDLIKEGIHRFDRDSASRLARVYMQQAEIYYKDKKYIQAVRTLENAALLEPYNKETSNRLEFFRQEMDEHLNRQMIEKNQALAIEYFERGDFITSRQYWQSVLEIDPENFQGKEYLEKIDRKMTDMEKEIFKRQAEAEISKKIVSILDEASSLLKNEKYSQSILKAKKILSISPGNKEALSIISIAENGMRLSIEKRLKEALLLCEKKQVNDALKIIESVLKDSPDNKDAIEGTKFCKASWEIQIPAEEKKKIEQFYYMAVDSYLKNNYKETQKYIDEIYKIDALNENTKNLEEKLKKVK